MYIKLYKNKSRLIIYIYVDYKDSTAMVPLKNAKK